MSNSSPSDDLYATAEALSSLADLLESEPRDSPKVRQFLEQHQQLPEFRELAEEALRLSSLAAPPAKPRAYAVPDPIEAAPVRRIDPRRLLSYAAGFLGLMIFLGAGAIAVEFGHRAQSIRGEYAQLEVNFNEKNKLAGDLKIKSDTLATEKVALANKAGELQTRNEKLEIEKVAQEKKAEDLRLKHAKLEKENQSLHAAAKRDAEEERQFMRAFAQYAGVLHQGQSEMSIIKPRLKAGQVYMASGFQDKIPQLTDWALTDSDAKVSQGATFLLHETYKSTGNPAAWQALATISTGAKNDETRKTAKILFIDLPRPTGRDKDGGIKAK